MILVTHGIIGGAVVALLPTHPVIGVTLAFASHFAFDAIPHWDYKIYSQSIHPDFREKLRLNKNLILDILRIGSDGLAGLLLSLLFFYNPQHNIVILLGAFAGMFPDFLQFVFSKFPHPPLSWLQIFHRWIHTKQKLGFNNGVGPFLQVIMVVLIVVFVKYVIG